MEKSPIDGTLFENHFYKIWGPESNQVRGQFKIERTPEDQQYPFRLVFFDNNGFPTGSGYKIDSKNRETISTLVDKYIDRRNLR